MDGSSSSKYTPLQGDLSLRIALGHQARVGKDTFAEQVIKRYGGYQVSFAEGVYELAAQIQSFFGFDIRKDPGLLQLIGVGMREHYSADIWVNRADNRIKEILSKHPRANIIITDMRFPNEMEYLTRTGFTTVKITRENRPIDRDPNHISETALAMSKFDFHIANDGTKEEFLKNVDKLAELLVRRRD